jgi:predicted transcriptional regulator
MSGLDTIKQMKFLNLFAQEESMTRTHALKKLLEHGPLTRQEIIEMTGWKAKQVHFTLSYLAEIGAIVKQEKTWRLS